MRTIRLSNGVRIRGYVGDGFDGASGVYYDVPRMVMKGQMPFYGTHGLLIPARDRNKLIRFLRWWVRAEMRLRHSEGMYWCNTSRDEPLYLGEITNPYQANFYLGHLEGTKRRKDYGKKKWTGYLT